MHTGENESMIRRTHARFAVKLPSTACTVRATTDTNRAFRRARQKGGLR